MNKNNDSRAGNNRADGSRHSQESGEFNDEDDCQFPANLTRDEYIEFNLLISRTTGILRHQKKQLIFLLTVLVVGYALLLFSKLHYHHVDFLAVVFMLVIMTLAIILYAGMPGYIRRAAASAYDQTVRNGYTYYGTIHVRDNCMIKRSSMSQVTIFYNSDAVFIESRDMMVLTEPGNKSIVLPARCLTKEDADIIRQCMQDRIKKEHRCIMGRLEARAKARMQPRPENPDSSELLVITIQYTRQEFISMVSNKSAKGFVRTLPVYGSVSILAGLLIGIVNGYYWGMAVFLLLLAIIFLCTVGVSHLSAYLSVRRMPPEALTLRVALSEKGMVIRSPVRPEQLEYIWPMITSAVERTKSVEFQAGNTFLRIPKRCIPELQMLKSLVDQHLS